MRLILIGILAYCTYRIILQLIPIFSVRREMKKEQRKSNIHKKVQKMDIQDAEYEDK